MLLLFLTASAASTSTPPDCGLISFSRQPALARTSEEVCIARYNDGQGVNYRLRQVSTDRLRRVTVAWATTKACPAVLPYLEAMEQLPMPVPDLPWFGNEPQEMTLDGAGYRLSTRALYSGKMSEVVVQSNVDTPLARWIDQTLAALAPCWRGMP
jgi:hypothetical protein